MYLLILTIEFFCRLRNWHCWRRRSPRNGPTASTLCRHDPHPHFRRGPRSLRPHRRHLSVHKISRQWLLEENYKIKSLSLLSIFFNPKNRRIIDIKHWPRAQQQLIFPVSCSFTFPQRIWLRTIFFVSNLFVLVFL